MTCRSNPCEKLDEINDRIFNLNIELANLRSLLSVAESEYEGSISRTWMEAYSNGKYGDFQKVNSTNKTEFLNYLKSNEFKPIIDNIETLKSQMIEIKNHIEKHEKEWTIERLRVEHNIANIQKQTKQLSVSNSIKELLGMNNE